MEKRQQYFSCTFAYFVSEMLVLAFINQFVDGTLLQVPA